jgi:hypothetical protein
LPTNDANLQTLHRNIMSHAETFTTVAKWPAHESGLRSFAKTLTRRRFARGRAKGPTPAIMSATISVCSTRFTKRVCSVSSREFQYTYRGHVPCGAFEATNERLRYLSEIETKSTATFLYKDLRFFFSNEYLVGEDTKLIGDGAYFVQHSANPWRVFVQYYLADEFFERKLLIT